MKTLQLNIPEELEKELALVPTDSESFILSAIREKIKTLHATNVNSLLAEGYKSTREEDLAIAKEFEAADFEHVK
jgi:hypothetical protein